MVSNFGDIACVLSTRIMDAWFRTLEVCYESLKHRCVQTRKSLLN